MSMSTDTTTWIAPDGHRSYQSSLWVRLSDSLSRVTRRCKDEVQRREADVKAAERLLAQAEADLVRARNVHHMAMSQSRVIVEAAKADETMSEWEATERYDEFVSKVSHAHFVS